jgi:hypothetical protein
LEPQEYWELRFFARRDDFSKPLLYGRVGPDGILRGIANPAPVQGSQRTTTMDAQFFCLRLGCGPAALGRFVKDFAFLRGRQGCTEADREGDLIGFFAEKDGAFLHGFVGELREGGDLAAPVGYGIAVNAGCAGGFGDGDSGDQVVEDFVLCVGEVVFRRWRG